MQTQRVAQDELVGNWKLSDYAERLRKKYELNNKVLFVESPQFLFEALNLDVIKNRGYYAYPPTGLQCLTKTLSGRGLEIEILDLNYQFLHRVIHDRSFAPHSWLNILGDYLDRYNPSIVGVTALSVHADVSKPSFPLTAILNYLRKRDRQIILAGGPTASNEIDFYLENDYCHFIVDGEGENKINSLFDDLYDLRQAHSATPGIYFKYEEKIEQTDGRSDIVGLHGNLIDTYKLVPIEDYHNAGCLNPFSRMAGQDKHFSVIQLNRGCRADCKFCGVTKFMGKGVRQYLVKDVIDEMHYLVEERGIRHFEILDDDFLGPSTLKNGVTELLEAMSGIRQRHKITWSAGNGLLAASINEKLLSLMQDSGCIGFRVGIESGNSEMQRKMRKPVGLSSLRRFSRVLQKFPEIFVAGNYIIGLFGEETFGEMLDTFRFSCEMNLDGANFTIFQFTSKATVIAEKLKYDNREAKEFIPSKDNSKGEIAETEGVTSGPEIFNLAKTSIPSPEQMKQIWFTFNLVANYINNKNLKPGGTADKLAAWLEAVQLSYPSNPYMSLFAGLSHILAGNMEPVVRNIEKTERILDESGYWRHRFTQFSLTDIMANLPKNEVAVQTVLDPLRKRYSKWTG